MTDRAPRPRVGALGTGWIGRHRLEVLAAADLVDIVGVADASPAAVESAQAVAGGAVACDSLESLLALDLDGVIIATPTAQHAGQALQALHAGVAVCCQKPLARTEVEATTVVRAAQRADRLLAIDFSYRFTAAAAALRAQIAQDALGRLVAAELVFHNAYGPDKGWYRTPELAGGGCVMDLGVHLLDLLTWLTGDAVTGVAASRLYAEGVAWDGSQVETLAQCQLDLASGASAALTCSWWLPAGCEAVIGVTLYGSKGGLRLRNVGGSFYDFTAERLDGTRQEVLTSPPDAWGGRAVVDWAARLVRSRRYDPECETHLAVSRTIDGIYAAAAGREGPAAAMATVPPAAVR